MVYNRIIEIFKLKKSSLIINMIDKDLYIKRLKKESDLKAKYRMINKPQSNIVVEQINKPPDKLKYIFETLLKDGIPHELIEQYIHYINVDGIGVDFVYRFLDRLRPMFKKQNAVTFQPMVNITKEFKRVIVEQSEDTGISPDEIVERVIDPKRIPPPPPLSIVTPKILPVSGVLKPVVISDLDDTKTIPLYSNLNFYDINTISNIDGTDMMNAVATRLYDMNVLSLYDIINQPRDLYNTFFDMVDQLYGKRFSNFKDLGGFEFIRVNWNTSPTEFNKVIIIEDSGNLIFVLTDMTKITRDKKEFDEVIYDIIVTCSLFGFGPQVVSTYRVAYFTRIAAKMYEIDDYKGSGKILTYTYDDVDVKYLIPKINKSSGKVIQNAIIKYIDKVISVPIKTSILNGIDIRSIGTISKSSVEILQSSMYLFSLITLIKRIDRSGDSFNAYIDDSIPYEVLLEEFNIYATYTCDHPYKPGTDYSGFSIIHPQNNKPVYIFYDSIIDRFFMKLDSNPPIMLDTSKIHGINSNINFLRYILKYQIILYKPLGSVGLSIKTGVPFDITDPLTGDPFDSSARVIKPKASSPKSKKKGSKGRKRGKGLYTDVNNILLPNNYMIKFDLDRSIITVIYKLNGSVKFKQNVSNKFIKFVHKLFTIIIQTESNDKRHYSDITRKSASLTEDEVDILLKIFESSRTDKSILQHITGYASIKNIQDQQLERLHVIVGILLSGNDLSDATIREMKFLLVSLYENKRISRKFYYKMLEAIMLIK